MREVFCFLISFEGPYKNKFGKPRFRTINKYREKNLTPYKGFYIINYLIKCCITGLQGHRNIEVFKNLLR